MTSEIAVQNESSLVLTDALESRLKEAVLATLRAEQVEIPCEVSILLCTNDEIHRLNLEYRGKDSPTDVLSFPIYDSREELYEEANSFEIADFFCIGDVVIAPDVVKEAASEIGDPFEVHLCRMCIHSVLHLLGYDHETSPEDETVMLGKQEAILQTLF